MNWVVQLFLPDEMIAKKNYQWDGCIGFTREILEWLGIGLYE